MKYILIKRSRNEPGLSIVIPAYKEEKTIGTTLKELSHYIKHNDLPEVEVIVAIGKSGDQTLSKVREQKHLFSNLIAIDDIMPHEKGSVVHVGMMHAKGELCIYMDADLATPLHHMKDTVKLLQHNDIVNGQRNIQDIHSGHRKFISLFGNLLVRKILLPGFKDTQCGFKGFRTSSARKLFNSQKIDSWGFDMEILALGRKMKYRVAHLPIHDWKDVAGGTLNSSPAKALKAAVFTFYDLLRIRYFLLVGAYGARS